MSTHTVGTEVRRREAPPPAVRTRVAADAPQQWHRGMTLIATTSLFIGTRAAWTDAMLTRPPVAGVISVCYAGILVCGVLAFVVRSRRALVRVDVAVLVLAVALVVCGWRLGTWAATQGPAGACSTSWC